MAARDTASWNKAVANSEVFCRSADEGMDPRRLDAVSLLLFGSNSKASKEGKRQRVASNEGVRLRTRRWRWFRISVHRTQLVLYFETSATGFVASSVPH